MRKLIFLFLLFGLNSCEVDEQLPNTGDCGVMNPIGFVASPLDKSVDLSFASTGHWDGPFLSCPPESFEVFMSDDGIDFTLLTSVEGSNGSHLVEDLENGDVFFFKVLAKHSELEAVQSQVLMVTVGLIPLPIIMDNPLSVAFEVFSLGPDGDQFLYRSISDDWYVSSLSNPVVGEKLIDDSFQAKWNPHNDNEICFREKHYVQIAPNTNGVTSKSLVALNLVDGSENLLHEIEETMDFGTEFIPEQYWIHDYHYSIDESSIYFTSNKDNGSTTRSEKHVFNNIWKLDLESKVIEPISDFLPINFEMKSFVEDPKSPNNFYVLGGTNGEVVEIEGAIFNPEQVDVYYYNSTSQSLDLILETTYEEETLTINPSGEKLLITNAASGANELWSYDLTSKNLKQISQSNTYRPNKRYYYPSWISDTAFMLLLVHEDEFKLATFTL